MLLLTLVVLPFGLSVAFYLAEGAPRDPNWQPPMTPLILVLKSASAALALLMMIGIARWWRVSTAEFGARTDDLGLQLLFVAPTLIGVYVMMFAIGIPLMLFLFETGQEDELAKRVDFIEGLELPNIWVTIVSMLLVATHEEILFRGMAIPILRRLGLPAWAAVAVISLAFGSLHFDQGWSGILQITGVSVALGTAFVLTRSLLAVVLAHAAFNVIGTLMVEYAGPLIKEAAESQPASQAASQAVGLVLSIVLGN